MAEIDLVPKLRFPEFNGVWSTNILGDIAAFSKGKGISKADIDEDGKLECIRYGELYTDYPSRKMLLLLRTLVTCNAAIKLHS